MWGCERNWDKFDERFRVLLFYFATAKKKTIRTLFRYD